MRHLLKHPAGFRRLVLASPCLVPDQRLVEPIRHQTSQVSCFPVIDGPQGPGPVVLIAEMATEKLAHQIYIIDLYLILNQPEGKA